MSLFTSFTNLYSLSKTLRFELKPTENTKKLIEQERNIEKDKKIDEDYKKIKVYLDKLHRKFVDESLKEIELLGVQGYFDELKKSASKYSKNLEDITKKLREQIVSFFDKKDAEWNKNLKESGDKIKNEKSDKYIILSQNVLSILVENFPEEKKMFENFKGFFTYLSNYNQSRENFYKNDGNDTSISYRAIDVNLRYFCGNILLYRDYPKEFLKILTAKEKSVFELNFYNGCLLQEGIDAYNGIVGEVNKKINLFKQQNKNKDLKINNPGFLKILYKQILGEKDRVDFGDINDNKELIEKLKAFIKENKSKRKIANDIFDNFINYKKFSWDLGKIYLSKRAINTLSQKFLGDWQKIMSFFPEKGKLDNISIAELEKRLDDANDEKLGDREIFKETKENKDVLNKILNKNRTPFENFINIWENEWQQAIKKVENDEKKLENKLSEQYNSSDDWKEKIKDYCDASLNVHQMIKYFDFKKRESVEMENEFYNKLDDYNEDYKLIKFYNDFRNYLTKKPFSEDKIKLNFENGQLLSGFDVNKEPDELGIIIKKDGKYYLGVMNKRHKNIFNKTHEDGKGAYEIGGDYYEKMEYKFLPDPKRMIPKVAFALSNEEEFSLTEELKRIKSDFDEFQKQKKDNWEMKFDKNRLIKLIDYYKHCLETRKDWRVFHFEFKDSNEYKNLSEFYKDVGKKSYRMEFVQVDKNYVDTKVKKSELYLFEIYNKDFSDKNKKRGKENLHTTYFKLLFDDKNLENPILKLSGGAEIFYREKTKNFKKEKIKTQKDKIIDKKDEVYHSKRYAEDRYFLHLPILLNFGAGDKRPKEFNAKVNKIISKNKNVNIIGIDRGEKNLIYYSVIDESGKILESNSLNKVNDVDYLQKLKEMEMERAKSRLEWKEIAKIKDLKAGYISQVVRKIADLIMKYNAIVVLEDLNYGFKRGRFKFERQVYQNLEIALINKLNYLVNKNEKNYLSAYQLTPPFESYDKVRKQTGIIFYTQANYTSATCPKCGFRRRKYMQFETIKKAREVFKNIDISFKNDKFEFKFIPEYRDKNVKFNEKTRDVVYSDVDRLRWNNRDREIKPYNNITDELKKLFKNIDKININRQLQENSKLDSDFWKRLIYWFNLVLQIRNSESKKVKKKDGEVIEKDGKVVMEGRDIDYILCPHCGFDSRKVTSKKLPKNLQNITDGDANGAYNIARKGLIVLDKIRKFKDLDALSYKDLDVSIEEWDKFIVKR